jgi:hypothetical protein
MVDKDYVKFEDIPKSFYDHTLDAGIWEDALIDGMKKLEQKKDKTEARSSFGGKGVDIFNEMSNVAHKNMQEESRYSKPVVKVPSVSERIRYDMDLRQFLYNKGVDIPNSEMDREFYLRERLDSTERNNCLRFFRALQII